MFTKLTDKEGKYIYFEISKQKSQENTPNQHFHDVFEIYFLEKGECRYFIDNKTYLVEEGDLILIPKGIIHKTLYGDDVHIRQLINCSYHYIPTDIIPKFPSIIYHYRNESILPEIRELFSKISKEYTKKDEFSDDAILNYVHLLFYLLARNKNQIDKTQKGNRYVTEVFKRKL